MTAARLYDVLADQLITTGQPGEKTSGSRNPGLKINPAVIDARIDIKVILTSWTLLIAEIRGIRLPVDDVGSLGLYVARHAVWLAAQPDTAADASAELRSLVHGAYPLAYPSGTRRFDVAPCPTEGCPGTLRAVLRRSDALLPPAIVCSRDDSHAWSADRWLSLGRQIRGMVV